jgi:hypothetical protein
LICLPSLFLLFFCFIVGYFYFYFIFTAIFFFLSILSTSPSLSSHPFSQPLHSPSFFCATFHCSPSRLFFLPLLIHSFPHLHLLLPSSPNLSPHCPSLLHTHHLWTNLPYQLNTTPIPCKH